MQVEAVVEVTIKAVLHLVVLVAVVLEELMQMVVMVQPIEVVAVVVQVGLVLTQLPTMVDLEVLVSYMLLMKAHNEDLEVPYLLQMDLQFIPSHHPVHLPLNKPNEHKYSI
jgi:hypothetical protein